MIEVLLKGVKLFEASGDNLSVSQKSDRGSNLVRVLIGRDCNLAGFSEGDTVDVTCLLGQKDGKRYYLIATSIREAA